MVELLVLSALVMGVVTVIAVVFGALSFVGWVIALPFQLIGLLFKGIGFLLTLPFMLLGLILGAFGMVMGLGAGALGLVIGFGVLALLALPFMLPLALIALIVWWMRGPAPRRA